MPRLVILGAGFGGLEACAETKLFLEAMEEDERSKWSVVIIEKSEYFLGGLAMQYIVTKRRAEEECKRYYKDCVYKDFTTWIHDEIVGIDPEKKFVLCKNEAEPVPYDHLLVALGATAKYPPLVKDKVLNICSLRECHTLSERLHSFTGGTVVVCVSRLPFKCPPAPFEYALIIEEFMRERGIRDKCKIILSFPKHSAVPVACPEAVTKLLQAHDVVFHPGVQPKEISAVEGGGHLITWMPHPKFNPDASRCPVPNPTHADLLLGTLPHQASPVLQPWANDKGFVPADTFTLRTRHDSVYCVGDCNWLMIPTKPKPRGHPKAGGFAEGQARIAIRNIFSGASWDEPAPHRQDASCEAVCAMESGLHSLLLLSINLHEVEGKPKFTTGPIEPGYKLNWWNTRMVKHFGK